MEKRLTVVIIVFLLLSGVFCAYSINKTLSYRVDRSARIEIIEYSPYTFAEFRAAHSPAVK